MDIETIEKISTEIFKLAERYPQFRLCCVVAEPCKEHNGAHTNLASMGDSVLTEFVDEALLNHPLVDSIKINTEIPSNLN